MNEIEANELQLSETFQKLSMKGSFAAVSAEKLGLVQEVLTLSPELTRWYQTSAPLNLYIPWHGDDLLLYDPHELVDWQDGYRWESGHRDIVVSYWNENWVVIGALAVTRSLPIQTNRARLYPWPYMESESGNRKQSPRPCPTFSTFSLSGWISLSGVMATYFKRMMI